MTVCSELHENLKKKKNINWVGKNSCTIHYKKIYIMSMSSAPVRCRSGRLQLSMPPLWEDRVSLWRTGREWMSDAWRGRSDISTPTVCHSGFQMMYGCYMAPLTQQDQSILPCRGMLLWDNRRLWPLLWNDKTPWGWRGKEWGLWVGGAVFYSISHSQQSYGGNLMMKQWKNVFHMLKS